MDRVCGTARSVRTGRSGCDQDYGRQRRRWTGMRGFPGCAGGDGVRLPWEARVGGGGAAEGFGTASRRAHQLAARTGS